jgi:Alpha-2,8-polysialyltransferase (POLYST)
LNVCVFTIGTFVVLQAAAFLRQMDIKPKSVNVFHYMVTDQLIESERWLCQVLGYNHAGDLGLRKDLELYAESLFDGVSGNWLWRFPSLRKRWRKMGRKLLAPLDPEKIDILIYPYHPLPVDALLINLFPNAKIYFLCEGLMVGFKPDVHLPRPFRWAGFDNPFDRSKDHPIWSLARLRDAMEPFGTSKTLEEQHWNETLEKVASHREFEQVIKGLTPDEMKEKFSCLLLQPFANWGGHIDYPNEMIAWASIINRELASSDETMLVKPHPRDHQGKLDLLNMMILEQHRNRVRFMRLDPISTLPAELFFRRLQIQRLVGLCSSALLTAPTEAMEIRMYKGGALPEALNCEIDRCAGAGGIKPIDLASAL